MKSIGIVRNIDMLGRIVIPVELRNYLNIESGDAIEIFAEEDRIILKTHEQSCLFCKSGKKIKWYIDKPICQECIDKIKAISSTENE
jgi:looped-hinge helix DNA binding domain, AbrB family